MNICIRKSSISINVVEMFVTTSPLDQEEAKKNMDV